MHSKRILHIKHKKCETITVVLRILTRAEPYGSKEPSSWSNFYTIEYIEQSYISRHNPNIQTTLIRLDRGSKQHGMKKRSRDRV